MCTRRGHADGDAFRTSGSARHPDGHAFDLKIPAGGYAWWYIDALSDDEAHGLSLIAFVGSVFSPYYAWERRKAGVEADPENHVSVNVALYGSGGYRWAMTERGKSQLTRNRDNLVIGPSNLAWREDGCLEITFDEICVPIPRRIRGRIVVEPVITNATPFEIDALGRHVWQPLAPLARVTVERDSGKRWHGHAYIDHNRGTEPLTNAFHSWSWSRTFERDRTRIFYDTKPRRGAGLSLGLCFQGGRLSPLECDTQLQPYRNSAWQLPLEARSDNGTNARHIETWEDGPFYARNLIEHQIAGLNVKSVHEVVSLHRFDMTIVQAMLPFRMPRRRG